MLQNTPSSNRFPAPNFTHHAQALVEINGWNQDARNRLGFEQIVDRARSNMDGAGDWGKHQVLHLISRHSDTLRSVGLELEAQTPLQVLGEAGPEGFHRLREETEVLRKKLNRGLLSTDRFDQLIREYKGRYLRPGPRFLSPFTVGVRIAVHQKLHDVLGHIQGENLSFASTRAFVSALASCYHNEILAWGLGQAGDGCLDLVNDLDAAHRHFIRLKECPDSLTRLHQAKSRGYLHAQILLEHTGIHEWGDNQHLHPRSSFSPSRYEGFGSLVMPDSYLITMFSASHRDQVQMRLQGIERKWQNYIEAFLSIPPHEELHNVRDSYRRLFCDALEACENDIELHPDGPIRSGLRAIAEDARKIFNKPSR